MKRNFLLMLLLTLLPFAGWADVDVTVGTYTVTLDKQYIAVGQPLPTVSKVIKGETNVSFSQISVVKSDKTTEVASITLPGIYYRVVKANVSADSYDKLLVPFYAGDPIDFDFIYNKESFDESVTSGAHSLYYPENPQLDSRESLISATTEGAGGWSFIATKDATLYPDNAYLKKQGFPQIGFLAPETGSFKPAFSYTGETTPANAIDGELGTGGTALFATPWGNRSFGPAEDQKKYGIASFNALYGTGMIYREDGEDKTDPNYNFDEDKFSAFWIPTDLDFASTDVAVAPITYKKVKIMARVFHVPFGTDVTGNQVTSSMFTILPGSEEVCSEEELAASGHLTFVYLDGDNTNVSIQGHPFKIEYDGLPWEYSPISEATEIYEIVIVTDQNTMYFDATPNSFEEGQIPTVVSSDLTYNAEAQNLISSTGKTMFVHADETASNVKYLVVTADKVTAVEDKFKLNYEPAASEWTDDATATDVAYTGEGAERQIDYYYVFAKASAGIGEEEGWTEGKTVEYIGKVKMQKATPVLEMAGIDPQYYLKSRSTETNGLHKALTPVVTVKVASGKVDTDNKPLYNTLTAGKEYKAEDISVVVCTKPSFNPQYYLQNFKCSTVGEYRITSAIAANDNLNELGIGPSYGFVDFTVVRPKVIVPVIVDDVPFATEPNPTIGTEDWTTAGYHDGEILVGKADPAKLQWKLQTIPETTEATPVDVQRDLDDNYPAGTWTVVATDGYKVLTSNATGAPEADHEIVYETTTINIGMADIEAQVPNRDLVYGQDLPMNLQHKDGLTGDYAQNVFNNTTSWKFVATLVDAETHTAILDKDGKEQKTNLPLLGGTLDAGTYKVTCSGQTFHMPNAQNQFKVIAGAGYWTVTPKKLDNSDYRRNVVNRIQGYWATNNRPYVTYNGEAQLPVDALAGITYNGVALKADIPAKPATYYAEGDEIPEGKKVGDEKTPAEPAVAQDYSVEVLSAGGNIHAANNIQIRLTGHGNYQLSTTLAYDIRKKTIQVLPEEATWKCGSDEVVDGKSIYDINWVDLFSKLVPADQKNNAFLVETATKTEGEGEDAKEVTYIKTNNLKKQDGFKDLAVRRPTGPNVGTFDNGIEAYLPSGKSVAQDYNFQPGTGKIVIEPGLIALKVNPNMKAEYAGKGAYPLTAGEFVLDAANSTLGEFYVEDDNWKQLVDGIQTTGELGWTYPQLSETVTRFNVGDEYRISIGTNAANSMSSTNYEIVITPDEKNGTTASALVEITKAPLTLKSEDQGPYDFEKLATEFKTTKDQVTATGLKGGDVLSDVVTYDEEDFTGAVSYDPATVTTGENEKAIDINTKENGNYTVTKDKGTLTVNLAANLILYSNMETKYKTVDDKQVVDGELGDKDKITKWDGKPTNKVTLYLKAPKLIQGEIEKPAYSEWKANEWHAMVLPFSVKIRDLSNAFGYAIVNVVDPDKTKENDVRFKLVNISYTADAAIPANTPFCIKADEDFDFAAPLVFGGKENATVTVEKPTDWTVGVNAGLGYHFEGTYNPLEITNEQSYLRFLGTGSKWAFVGKEGTTYYMQPYTGYVNLQSFADTREVTFTFEEADGSTTSIKAVDFMNGKNSANAEGLYRVDGIKLQSAPTQKGVYVQDGKKFVK